MGAVHAYLPAPADGESADCNESRESQSSRLRGQSTARVVGWRNPSNVLLRRQTSLSRFPRGKIPLEAKRLLRISKRGDVYRRTLLLGTGPQETADKTLPTTNAQAFFEVMASTGQTRVDSTFADPLIVE